MIENEIYLGDAENVLKEKIPDNTIDLTITSPPYSDLRHYGNTLSNETWNDDKFRKIADELYRVTKNGGVIVWIVNDKTENGGKSLVSFRQALYFQEIGFIVNDVMIWCLSGGTHLYVKTFNGVSVMPIKDMVRLNPSNVQLWNGVKWVNVLGWRQNTISEKKIRIQLRSGENIYCTKEHRWILSDGREVATECLKPGDVLKTCTLPDDGSHNPSILSNDILWLIGLYIAEGSRSGDTIQLSLCSDEIRWIDRINSTIESLGGTVRYSIVNKSLNVRIYSRIFDAILRQYTGGKTAKDKHLSTICWHLSNEALKNIVDGYLDGDGCYDKPNDRWRLGFTVNQHLEQDLRTLAARLGATITLLRRGSRIKSLNKTYPSIKGEWRWHRSGHPNEKPRSEILLISEEKIHSGDKMWDIEVDSSDHLFSLSSGVLTHNCKTNPMPVVKQPRYADVFEYMFVFSKGKPKTFNPIMVPCKCAGQEYHSTTKNMGGENGRTYKEFNINKEKIKENVWNFAIAQNKSGHPAVFPQNLIEEHIKSWSNEGDLVLDPFMGSGTTALAAKKLNRKYVGIEINEEYCNLINNRINNSINK